MKETTGKRAHPGEQTVLASAEDSRNLYSRLCYAADLIQLEPPGASGPRLIFRNSAGELMVIPIPLEGLIVGRGSPGFPRDDMKLSRRHFRIQPDQGEFVIEDLHSRNGSWVNRARVAAKVLCNSDIIDAGRSTIVFLSGEECMAGTETDPAVKKANEQHA